MIFGYRCSESGDHNDEDNVIQSRRYAFRSPNTCNTVGGCTVGAKSMHGRPTGRFCTLSLSLAATGLLLLLLSSLLLN